MSLELVDDWHAVLVQDEEWQRWWTDVRGISFEVLRERRIGVQAPRADAPNDFRFTIPVFDAKGELVDVKKYAPGTTDGKNKHTKGYGSPCRLYGVDWLAEADPESDEVWIFGGEPDALRGMSEGLLALTGTSGEGALPRQEDLERLRGFNVNLCLDMDGAGRRGVEKWTSALLPIVAEIRIVEWPAKDGKDLTDWLNNGQTVRDLWALSAGSSRLGETQRPRADLLAAALRKVASGEGRNQVGFWLACQLRDERYSRAIIERFMTQEYVPEVTGPEWEHDYTDNEAMFTVESVFQHGSPRAPSGIGATSGSAASTWGRTSENDPGFKDAMLNANYTDTGNAQRLKNMYGAQARYCPAFRSWLIWNGRYWERDTALKVNRIAKEVISTLTKLAVTLPEKQRRDVLKWCLASESQAKLDAMVKNAQSELTITPTELNTDPYKFNCENGTVDLRNGELHEHDPADLITMMAPVECRLSATDSRWEEVLDRFVRPDDGKEAFLGRAAFESLTGTTSSKAFLNLYDDNNGDTGKTTFLEALLAAWGPYGGVVNAESFLTKPHGGASIRADLADCAGKRLVVSSETPPGRKLDTALMKKLTAGSGTYQFERKYENPWSGEITFTIWIDGNSVAKANAEDNPLFSRWRLTPFTHKIDRRKIDRRWVEKAAASPEFRAAVLAWAMQYRAEWLADGIGTAPVVQRAVEEVRTAMDPLGEFWEECCVFGAESFATTDQLMARYEDWAFSKVGLHQIGRDAFIALLKRHPVENKPKRIDGEVVRGWVGVGLVPAEKRKRWRAGVTP